MAQIQKENLLPLYAGDTAGYVRIVGADGISYRYSIQALIDLAAEDPAIAGKIGDLDDLTTEDKASLVAAINEVSSSGGGGGGGGSVSPYTSTPSALGTANAGSSAKYSRGDHVHPMPSASDVGALPSSTVIPTKTSELTNDSGFITSAPVTSVNSQTGAVVISNATTSASGLMSATDKGRLDDLYADYSSALTALGVI